jgi:ParB family chromosome partitioning protein
MMSEHHLKTWPQPFADVWSGKKPFEVRKFDRDYKPNDIVRLFEFDPVTGQFSGRYVRAGIGYVLKGGAYGLPSDIGVFSIDVYERRTINTERAARWCCTTEGESS